ncbi:MAG: polyketide antibiotic transporter, partial [Acidimicrobiales bacterium]
LTAIMVAAAPRAAYAVLALVLGAGYLIAVLGPSLHWPAAVIDLSVFHFVALVPYAPPNWAAVVTFVVAGVGLVAVGSVGFARRDLVAAG